MRTPYVNFRELKAAVGIRQVLERYGALAGLEERGDRLSGPCPICQAEGAAFRASQEKSCFKCFACGEGGNMLDLVAAVEECSLREAAARVAERFGMLPEAKPARRAGKEARRPPTPPAGPKPDRPKPAPEPPRPDPGPAPPSRESPEPRPDRDLAGENRPLTFELRLDPDHPWLAEAGLAPETVREFGLGFCGRGTMAGRIAFPLRNPAGELVGYAGRWPGREAPEGQPLWRYPKGIALDLVVYPAERLVGCGSLLLAADPLEAVLLWQLGSRCAAAIPGGEITRRTLGVLSAALG